MAPPARVYGPHNLGGLCEGGCGLAIPAGLPGMTRHPTCIEEWPELERLDELAQRRVKRADRNPSQT